MKIQKKLKDKWNKIKEKQIAFVALIIIFVTLIIIIFGDIRSCKQNKEILLATKEEAKIETSLDYFVRKDEQETSYPGHHLPKPSRIFIEEPKLNFYRINDKIIHKIIITNENPKINANNLEASILFERPFVIFAAWEEEDALGIEYKKISPDYRELIIIIPSIRAYDKCIINFLIACKIEEINKIKSEKEKDALTIKIDGLKYAENQPKKEKFSLKWE